MYIVPLFRAFIPKASAAYPGMTVQLNTGINAGVPALLSRVAGFLAASGVAVCTALFLIGAFMMVLNAGKPDKAEQGKDVMIQSVIGLFVILGSYGILRTVFYILI